MNLGRLSGADTPRESVIVMSATTEVVGILFGSVYSLRKRRTLPNLSGHAWHMDDSCQPHVTLDDGRVQLCSLAAVFFLEALEFGSVCLFICQNLHRQVFCNGVICLSSKIN